MTDVMGDRCSKWKMQSFIALGSTKFLKIISKYHLIIVFCIGVQKILKNCFKISFHNRFLHWGAQNSQELFQNIICSLIFCIGYRKFSKIISKHHFIIFFRIGVQIFLKIHFKILFGNRCFFFGGGSKSSQQLFQNII